MRRAHKPILAIGIKERYREFLRAKGSFLKLKAFGISRRTALQIAVGGKVPSLREALCIDCVTNGEIDVYGWVDTEYMEQRSNYDCEREATTLWTVWPKPLLQEYRKTLRVHMVQRLGSPDRNAFAIVAKLGINEITKEVRQAQRLAITSLPCFVDEEATDEEVKRAIERHQRRRARAIAYARGQRSSIAA